MKTQVGYIYKTDGSVEKIYPKKGKKFQYEELRDGVGGYIESLVPGVKNCKQMFCNEEGMILGLPPNPKTWDLVRKTVYQINGYGPEWRVSGNILVILNEEIQAPDMEKK